MWRAWTLGVVAIAAGGIATVAGAQQPPEHGNPRPETVRVEPMQVADPAGGAPWGVRDYRTTSGRYCSETGRRVGDAIGTVDDTGAFHESDLGSGAWLCQDAAPSDPPVSIGTSVVYMDQSGVIPSCDPRPSSSDAAQRCDPHRTRTVVMVTAGKGLVAVSVRRGHSVRHVVVPRRATVFLDVVRGASPPPNLELTFRGGCNARHRKRLLKFHDARRVGCHVVIPLHLAG